MDIRKNRIRIATIEGIISMAADPFDGAKKIALKAWAKHDALQKWLGPDWLNNRLDRFNKGKSPLIHFLIGEELGGWGYSLNMIKQWEMAINNLTAVYPNAMKIKGERLVRAKSYRKECEAFWVFMCELSLIQAIILRLSANNSGTIDINEPQGPDLTVYLNNGYMFDIEITHINHQYMDYFREQLDIMLLLEKCKWKISISGNLLSDGELDEALKLIRIFIKGQDKEKDWTDCFRYKNLCVYGEWRKGKAWFSPNNPSLDISTVVTRIINKMNKKQKRLQNRETIPFVLAIEVSEASDWLNNDMLYRELIQLKIPSYIKGIIIYVRSVMPLTITKPLLLDNNLPETIKPFLFDLTNPNHSPLFPGDSVIPPPVPRRVRFCP